MADAIRPSRSSAEDPDVTSLADELDQPVHPESVGAGAPFVDAVGQEQERPSLRQAHDAGDGVGVRLDPDRWRGYGTVEPCHLGGEEERRRMAVAAELESSLDRVDGDIADA